MSATGWGDWKPGFGGGLRRDFELGRRLRMLGRAAAPTWMEEVRAARAGGDGQQMRPGAIATGRCGRESVVGGAMEREGATRR
uniref:Uncharacterized protein n=2 Tax=Oryza TaxID=4527 RepID=A0A0D3FM61_9ORYZ